MKLYLYYYAAGSNYTLTPNSFLDQLKSLGDEKPTPS